MLNDLEQITLDKVLTTEEIQRYLFRLVEELNYKTERVGTTNAEVVSVPNPTSFDVIYPVGSIYMSVNSTSPADLFGGVWERIKDTFLLSAGDTYSAGTTGGEADHQLLQAELPHLTGSIQSRQVATTNVLDTYPSGESGVFKYTANGGNTWGNQISGTSAATNANALITYDNGGTDTAHNNMPPYLVVYVWKRTA